MSSTGCEEISVWLFELQNICILKHCMDHSYCDFLRVMNSSSWQAKGNTLYEEISLRRQQVLCPAAKAAALSLLSIYEIWKPCTRLGFGSVTSFSRLEANWPVTRCWFDPTKTRQDGEVCCLCLTRHQVLVFSFFFFLTSSAKWDICPTNQETASIQMCVRSTTRLWWEGQI